MLQLQPQLLLPLPSTPQPLGGTPKPIIGTTAAERSANNDNNNHNCNNKKPTRPALAGGALPYWRAVGPREAANAASSVRWCDSR